MRFLVVGAGARRQVVAERILNESPDNEVWATPPLPQLAWERLHSGSLIDNGPEAIAAFAVGHKIDLAVLTSEREMFTGLADTLRGCRISTFGPGTAGAHIEKDRLFAKKLLRQSGVCTPRCSVYTLSDLPIGLSRAGFPCYAKSNSPADASAVRLLRDPQDANDWCAEMRILGSSGPFLLEEIALGLEYTAVAYTDGNTAIVLPVLREYKKAGNCDTGSNTGGMGAVAPLAVADPDRLAGHVFYPIIRTLRSKGVRYHGAITANIVDDGATYQVIELNVHLGDPETAALLPLLGNEYGRLLYESATGTLSGPVAIVNDLCVVMVTIATADYPAVAGIAGSVAVPEGIGGENIFYYDITDQDGTWYFRGGRVLSVRGSGSSVPDAVADAYRRLRRVMGCFSYEERARLHYRTDIGADYGCLGEASRYSG